MRLEHTPVGTRKASAAARRSSCCTSTEAEAVRAIGYIGDARRCRLHRNIALSQQTLWTARVFRRRLVYVSHAHGTIELPSLS